jgi:hypothetical protein
MGENRVEVSLVRRRLKTAIDAARARTQQRRQLAAEATRAYDTFLQEIAVPIARQLANALKAEGYGFAVSTPGDGVRLASERTRDDFIEVRLDTSGDTPQVMARVSAARGSRVRDEEVPVKPGASPDTISEEELLEFLLRALEPWIER